MHLRRTPLLVAAIAATLPAVFARAQVVLDENFDDGNGASRWSFQMAQWATDPKVIPTVDFNFDYGAFNYDNYLSGTAVPTPIPAAPGSTTTKGVKLKLDHTAAAAGNSAANLAIGAIVSNDARVSGDFRIEGYVWANYNGGPGDKLATMGGTGSTEHFMVGLNRNVAGGAATAGVGGYSPTGGGASAGYGFSTALEGGTTSDMRINSLEDTDPLTPATDDGAGYAKRNAAWPGTVSENRYNLTTGDLILTNTTGTGALVKDTPDNHANSYYRTEVFTEAEGFEIPGAPAKKWVKFEVEQRGRIVTYTMNGKIIGTLFNDGVYEGAPQLGYFDRIQTSRANPTATQFAIFDNLKATQLTTAPANTISGTDSYAQFNAGGSYEVAGATSISGLTVDSADAVTISGSGALTFTGVTGSLLVPQGTHQITKPITIATDSAIMVGNTGLGVPPSIPSNNAVLTLTNVTYAPTADLTKTGMGRLNVPNVRSKSLTLVDGTLALTGLGAAGASKVSGFDVGYPTSARLDFGKTILAVDYVARASSNPAVSNNPFVTIQNFLVSGAAFVGVDPQWTGPGLITSAPEVQGAAFNDPSNRYTVRLAEASALGYTDGAAWAGGMTIDATTVLVGFTFRADSNLDGAVNFPDLLKLAKNYNMSALDPFTSWMSGDSNGDGTVNFPDLLALAKSYNATISGEVAGFVTGSFEGDWALAQTLVPEPASFAIFGIAAAGLLGRRRR